MIAIATHGSAGARAPRVSIGMPVWNGQDFIRQGIESLLGQSFGDFELIISDNASTDDTQAICEEYGRADKRIHYHRNDVNTGLQANFAKVLELATAPYYMWGCHDDHWDPSYIAKMVDVLDHRADVVLAGSNAASIDQDGVVRRTYDNVAVYSPTGTAARAHRFIRSRPGGGHATLIYGLMRAPVIQRIGYVPLGKIGNLNRGYYAIDLVTVFKMLFEGEFQVTAETLYSHRDVVPTGVSRSPRTFVERLGAQRIKPFLKRLPEVHGYYRDLRTILGGSQLAPREKAALQRVALMQELEFYPAYARSFVARRLGRGGSGR